MQALPHPQAIRVIFFDAGFTLLRPAPSMIQICQSVCAKMGVDIELARLENRLPAAEDYFFRSIQEEPRTWAAEQTIATFWNGYYRELLRPFFSPEHTDDLQLCVASIIAEFAQPRSWATYDDVIPVLAQLKSWGRYTLGIISDWGLSLNTIIHELGLSAYFDVVVVSAALGYAKPDPALYELALRRADTIGDYAIHIGDSYIHDALGARLAGITPIVIDRRHVLHATDIDCPLIHDLRDVLTLLEIPEPVSYERRE
jgi:putative hydrolase of the HAD superfamily